jgi:signal peptidase I
VLALFDAHRCTRRGNDPGFESERRQAKDAWLAVFLTRAVLPGVGHMYAGRILQGVLVLVGFIAVVGLVSLWDAVSWLAHVLGAAAVALACLLAYRIETVRRAEGSGTFLGVGVLIGVVALAGNVLPGVLRARVVQAFRQSSESMSPTLKPGDFVFVGKSKAYVPGRGDVVAFTFPLDPTKDFLKRVVAIPGDTLVIRGRVLERRPGQRPSCLPPGS